MKETIKLYYSDYFFPKTYGIVKLLLDHNFNSLESKQLDAQRSTIEVPVNTYTHKNCIHNPNDPKKGEREEKNSYYDLYPSGSIAYQLRWQLLFATAIPVAFLQTLYILFFQRASLISGTRDNAEASHHGYGKRTYFYWAASAARGSE
jgi:hypothetical protein